MNPQGYGFLDDGDAEYPGERHLAPIYGRRSLDEGTIGSSIYRPYSDDGYAFFQNTDGSLIPISEASGSMVDIQGVNTRDAEAGFGDEAGWYGNYPEGYFVHWRGLDISNG